MFFLNITFYQSRSQRFAFFYTYNMLLTAFVNLFFTLYFNIAFKFYLLILSFVSDTIIQILWFAKIRYQTIHRSLTIFVIREKNLCNARVLWRKKSISLSAVMTIILFSREMWQKIFCRGASRNIVFFPDARKTWNKKFERKLCKENML